jgi:succinoglycan biosynthesis transport protein ExoP
MENKKSVLKQDEIDLKEVFKIFAKRKWWFVISLVVILILGLVYTFLQPINCQAIYQFELEETYSNSNLFKLYPASEFSLNYFNSENTPSIFKSANIFEALKSLPEDVDYKSLLVSDYVTIEQSIKANVFTVKASDPDCSLASKISLTLINAYDDYIVSENKEALDQVFALIDSEIGGYEQKNKDLEEEISKLEDSIDTVYDDLLDYIVDYNIELATRLKEESQGSYSSYNTVIPPNEFEDEIDFIKDEVNIYKEKIVDNKSEIVDLSMLRENLVENEEVITDRVNLLSETPIYETDNRRARNIIVTVALGIIVGVIVVFTANFFLSLRKRKS